MGLRFRNITATPDDPVSEWGVEGLAAAIERGGITHLQRIARRVLDEPDGDVALDLGQAIAITDTPLGGLLAEMVDRARHGPRAEVTHRIRLAIAMSGLTARECARRLGTSESRLSTYASGKVTPSATTLIRIENLGRR
ncbi:MAG: helix-turn-helix domain-containing protein [Bifidobacteriaceae bacterium]|jgi:hypothetical protein|nr:helix-turn-helix domain-containing protein [Bifidobacteriaceae bacterium]